MGNLLVASVAILLCALPISREDNVYPLAPLGLSFGATQGEVLQACDKAGLRVVRIDTGSAHFRIHMSGARVHGLPATYRFSGVNARPGLLSVGVTIRTGADTLLKEAHAQIMKDLSSAYGEPALDEVVRPESWEKAGFERETLWSNCVSRDGYRFNVILDAVVDHPVDCGYWVSVGYNAE